jgi:hypothetical protein
MVSWQTFSLLLAAAVAALAVARCGSTKATLATFAGTWQGHGRTLKITRAGLAKESIYSGCCHRVLAMEFRLSRPRSTPRAASATAAVTAVRIDDKSWFTRAIPAPQAGQSATIRLRAGIITEPLTRTNYCGPGIKDSIQAGCGA